MLDALVNGERQVAPDLSGIRRDHIERYRFAAQALKPGSRVIDLACGCGYGAAILADHGHEVLAVDRLAEALDYAREHYARAGIAYLQCEADRFVVPDGVRFDAAVCFETIEHLADPRALLRTLAGAAERLIASVPNEAQFPFRSETNGFRGYAHHHRHYTRRDLRRLLARCGWGISHWHGQIGPASDVEAEVDGRTVIAIAERIERMVPQRNHSSPAGTVPEHVTIIGLGPSCREFFELTRHLGGASAYCDEVWGINALGDVLKCDRIFHMDDLRIQEARAAARPGSNIAAMVDWLKTHPGPIYTSVPHPGYPGLVAFPLEEVLNGAYDGDGRAPYFNSTAAYAIAFAVHIGVKKISLFGLDYTMPNAHLGERGRACCEFWLGIAAARGIAIQVPETSALLDACAPERERLYGYDCVDVHLAERPDGSLSVSFGERTDIPSAEEIERRYDHSRHPNRMMQHEEATR